MGKETKTKPATLKFNVVGIVPGPIHFAGKNWDLSTATSEQIIQLHELGCPYLELVETEAES